MAGRLVNCGDAGAGRAAGAAGRRVGGSARAPQLRRADRRARHRLPPARARRTRRSPSCGPAPSTALRRARARRRPAPGRAQRRLPARRAGAGAAPAAAAAARSGSPPPSSRGSPRARSRRPAWPGCSRSSTSRTAGRAPSCSSDELEDLRRRTTAGCPARWLRRARRCGGRVRAPVPRPCERRRGAGAGCRGEPVPLTWAVDPDLALQRRGDDPAVRRARAGGAPDRPAGLRRTPSAGSPRCGPAADEGDRARAALRRPRRRGAEPHRLAAHRRRGAAAAARAGPRSRRLLDAEPAASRRLAAARSGDRRRRHARAGSGTRRWSCGPPPLAGRDAVARTARRAPARRCRRRVEPVTALVPDDVAVATCVAPDPTDDGWQGARLAEQRWLVETAMIAAERPGRVAHAGRRPATAAPTCCPALLAAALADTGRLPWLCGVPLVDVAAGTERCAQLPDAQGPAPAAGPAVAAPRRCRTCQALPPSFVRDVAAVRRDSDQFTEQVLTPDDDGAKAIRARLLRARGRAESTAWRTRPADGRRMLDLLPRRRRGAAQPGHARRRAGAAHRPRGHRAAGRAERPRPAGQRRRAPRPDQRGPADVRGHRDPGRARPAPAVQVSVRVEARTSGRFTARAGLVDASGQPFGETVELAVRSTQYGRVALAVTGRRRRGPAASPPASASRGALRPPAAGSRPSRASPRDRAAGCERRRVRAAALGGSARSMAVGTHRLARHRVPAHRRRRRRARRRARSPTPSTSPTPRRTSSTSCCSAACSPASSCRCWCAPRASDGDDGQAYAAAPADAGRPRARRRRRCCSSCAAPLVVDLYGDELSPRGARPRGRVRPLPAAAGAVLRRRRRHGRLPQHPRPLRPADVGARAQQRRRHRHRRRLRAHARARTAPSPTRSPTRRSPCSAIGVTLGIVAQTRRAGPGAARHRLPLPPAARPARLRARPRRAPGPVGVPVRRRQPGGLPRRRPPRDRRGRAVGGARLLRLRLRLHAVAAAARDRRRQRHHRAAAAHEPRRRRRPHRRPARLARARAAPDGVGARAGRGGLRRAGPRDRDRGLRPASTSRSTQAQFIGVLLGGVRRRAGALQRLPAAAARRSTRWPTRARRRWSTSASTRPSSSSTWCSTPCCPTT